MDLDISTEMPEVPQKAVLDRSWLENHMYNLNWRFDLLQAESIPIFAGYPLPNQDNISRRQEWLIPSSWEPPQYIQDWILYRGRSVERPTSRRVVQTFQPDGDNISNDTKTYPPHRSYVLTGPVKHHTMGTLGYVNPMTFSLEQNILVASWQAFILCWELHQVWEQPSITAVICVAMLTEHMLWIQSMPNSYLGQL